MNNLQKGFVVPLLIGIIALLVIGGGVYIYENKKIEVPTVDTAVTQPNQNQQIATQNNASGWQTYSYSDSSNTFSFQYPSGWVLTDLKPKTPTSDHTVIIKSPDSTSQKPTLLSVETWQSVGLRSTTAQITQFSNLKSVKLVKSTVDIGSISGTKFTGDTTNDGSFIIFEKNGYNYTISSRNVDATLSEKFYGSLMFNK